MRCWAAGLLVLATVAWGQQPASPSEAARRAQRESVERMRIAVARQLESAGRMRAALETREAAQPRPTMALGLIWPDAAPVSTCAPLPPDEIARLVQAAGEREGLGTELIEAVIRQESGFRPCAVSSKGALGLMQLMPATVGMLGVGDPFDPKENVDAGAKFLKSLLVRYEGDLKRALGAYNAGPTKIDQAGGVPDIAETKSYVEHILSVLGR